MVGTYNLVQCKPRRNYYIIIYKQNSDNYKKNKLLRNKEKSEWFGTQTKLSLDYSSEIIISRLIYIPPERFDKIIPNLMGNGGIRWDSELSLRLSLY